MDRTEKNKTDNDNSRFERSHENKLLSFTII
jgi:hypothetical protein